MKSHWALSVPSLALLLFIQSNLFADPDQAPGQSDSNSVASNAQSNIDRIEKEFINYRHDVVRTAQNANVSDQRMLISLSREAGVTISELKALNIILSISSKSVNEDVVKAGVITWLDEMLFNIDNNMKWLNTQQSIDYGAEVISYIGHLRALLRSLKFELTALKDNYA